MTTTYCSPSTQTCSDLNCCYNLTNTTDQTYCTTTIQNYINAGIASQANYEVGSVCCSDLNCCYNLTNSTYQTKCINELRQKRTYPS